MSLVGLVSRSVARSTQLRATVLEMEVGPVIAAELGQRVRPEEPARQRKAAALARWHGRMM